MIRRVFYVLLATLGLLVATQGMGSATTPTTVSTLPTYTYDSHPHAALFPRTMSERGPPAGMVTDDYTQLAHADSGYSPSGSYLRVTASSDVRLIRGDVSSLSRPVLPQSRARGASF